MTDIANDKWKRTSVPPSLKDGEIDLWSVDLDRDPALISASSPEGLPRVWRGFAFSNNGSIKAHCSSVSSSRRAIGEVYQTIFEMASKSDAAEEAAVQIVLDTLPTEHSRRASERALRESFAWRKASAGSAK